VIPFFFGELTMTNFHNKRLALYDLALWLCRQSQRMTFAQLVTWLNQRGHTTDYGTPFRHPRGAASAVGAAYAYVRDQLGLGDIGAAPIAEAFVDANGQYAYE
jgi:hypothetical protein